VNADLMRASGLGRAAEEREAAHGSLNSPVGYGRASMFGNGHAVAVRGMPGKRSVDFAFAFLRAADDQGQIFLVNLPLLELVGNVPLGWRVLGQEQDAAGFLVQAMGDAEPRIDRAGARESRLPGEDLDKAVGFPAAGDGG